VGVREEASRVVTETWREARDQHVTFMAGSIAYHAFVSMLPLLLFLLVALSTIGNEALTRRLTDLTGTFLTPYARRLLFDSLNAASALTGLSVVGAVTLLWGMSKIFLGLDVAFSQIYGVRERKPLLDQFENAVVVFLALALAIGVLAVAGAIGALAPDLPYRGVLNPVLLVVGLSVAFFPIYYVFPDVPVTAREVLPGVFFAAVGWATLEALFHAYVTVAGRYEAAYGTLGSVFLVLVWLYFGGLILLFGAVFNAVLAGRTRDEHALGVTDEESAPGPIEERDPGGPTVGGADGGRPAEGSDVAARDGSGPVRADLERATDAEAAAERARLAAEIERLAAENERLKRRNEALTRHLERRRDSLRARAKRWLFGDRE
jgi:membrane protein